MSSLQFLEIKSLLKETLKEFSKILLLKYENFDLTDCKDIIMKNCKIGALGKDYKNFLVTNDLIIFPIFENLENRVIALASLCLTKGSLQQIAGVLYISTNFYSERINRVLY